MRCELELPRQFLEVGTLHEVFFVDHQHAGQIHLGSHFRRLRRGGDLGRIERLVQLGIQPALQLAIIGQLGDFGIDQLALAGVDMPVGLCPRPTSALRIA